MVYRYLLSAFGENHQAVELTMNQVLFCDINRPIDIEFQEKLEHVYDADYYPVNFIDSVATAAKVNAYVKQQTQGRIAEIVQAYDLKMVHILLVSAIFFQGRWKVCLFHWFFFSEQSFDSNFLFFVISGSIPPRRDSHSAILR